MRVFMLKNKKRIVFALFAILLMVSSTCLAATTNSEKAKLEIVENNVCTIKINDFATFEKKIINSNLEKKEITIGLNIQNTAVKPLAKPTEIMLVIDTSNSMKKEVATGVTRMQAVTQAASKLATELLKNDTVKIGVVTFSTSDNFGTIADAKLKSPLTSSSSSLASTIASITYDGNGQTNIDAGLTLAGQNFSANCENKYIILLTDGVPNYSIGKSTYEYSGTTTANTKNTLTKLTSQQNVHVISAMTGVESNVENPETGKTYQELAEEIFGTPEKPNYGKFYYIPDSKIEETIANHILEDIVDSKSGVLTNVVIYDYFPKEITDNFNFEYVTSPNLGKVSASIDPQNNCIVWNIDRLEPQTSGSLSYKLTLKDTIDTNIVNVVLNTNKEVDITANEIKTEDGKNVITSTITPKVKVTIPEEPKPAAPKDNTVANTVIPQTGSTPAPYVVTAIIVLACLAIGIRYYFIKRNMK